MKVGSPIAEDDTLLFESRVETSVFSELLFDSIDLVQGTKGSGKSALYRLFADYLTKFLLEKRGVVPIKAVETRGDPIFAKFRSQFESFDEIDFENFWRIYFISLVASQFIGSPPFRSRQEDAKKEVTRFKAIAKAQGFPVKEEKFSLPGLVAWVLGKVPRVKRIGASFDPDTAMPEVGLEFDASQPMEDRTPAFVASLHEALIAVLEKCDLSLWIMVDRLDEVFPRRSQIERVALRALLRTTQAFKSKRLRLKIFLRDDIFKSVTEFDGGFVALSHVMSRSSHVLQWNREQILQLITNRIFTETSPVTRYFGVDRKRLANDQGYRLECFYYVFPPKLRPGARQSSTLDWIHKHCADGNGVVTPRDVIDLVNLARHHQCDIVLANHLTDGYLLSAAAIASGHAEMSKKKRDTYLRAEFDHFWQAIEKFEGQKAEHDEGSLRQLLKGHYSVVKDLCSVGFLKHNKRTDTYEVPFLYRPGLSIRQGKSRPSGSRS